MDPVVGAGLVEAGGDLVSSIAGNLFGGGAAKKAYKRQRKLLRDQIPLMVEGAVKAGLHPLAAIGVNPASGPAPAQVGDFAGMGAALGRATEAMLTPVDKVAARSALIDMETRQVNLDIAKAQLAGAHKALLTTGATPGIASRIPDINVPPGMTMSNRGKGDRLGSGKRYVNINDIGYGLGGGVSNDYLQSIYGESADLQGAVKMSQDLGYNFGNIGIWPGVLGY